MPRELRPPTRINLLREMAAGIDMVTAPAGLLQARLNRRKNQDGRTIIILPGFGANDLSTAPMRYYLEQYGHYVEGWSLGFNRGGEGLISNIDELSDRWDFDKEAMTVAEAGVPALCDRMIDHTKARAKALGRPISLIGWSLGGYVAREVARELSDEVEAVITMGSPVQGGPKYTSIAPFYRARQFDLDRMETEIRRRSDKPITQPITSIYSKRDGVVGWQAALDHDSPNIRHIEVNVSHLGLGLNRTVWKLVRDALAAVPA